MPGTPGAVIAAQTAGESLGWNPHLHSLVSCGTFLDDGVVRLVDLNCSASLEKLFADKVLTALKERALIDQAVIDQLYSQAHTGFSVWIGEPVAPTDMAQRLFLGRYIDRCPLSLEKLSICDDIVTYTTKDGTALEFSPVEFLARLSQHIPDKWEQMIRFYGAYSARTRGAKKQLQIALGITPLEHFEQKKPSKAWAACMKRIYELDPLLCPKCGSQMTIKAFITDSKEIERYIQKHGIPHYRAPPKISSKPKVQLILYSDFN